MGRAGRQGRADRQGERGKGELRNGISGAQQRQERWRRISQHVHVHAHFYSTAAFAFVFYKPTALDRILLILLRSTN